MEFKSTSTKISLSKELINQVPDALMSILPSDLIEVFPPAACTKWLFEPSLKEISLKDFNSS